MKKLLIGLCLFGGHVSSVQATFSMILYNVNTQAAGSIVATCDPREPNLDELAYWNFPLSDWIIVNESGAGVANLQATPYWDETWTTQPAINAVKAEFTKDKGLNAAELIHELREDIGDPTPEVRQYLVIRDNDGAVSQHAYSGSGIDDKAVQTAGQFTDKNTSENFSYVIAGNTLTDLAVAEEMEQQLYRSTGTMEERLLFVMDYMSAQYPRLGDSRCLQQSIPATNALMSVRRISADLPDTSVEYAAYGTQQNAIKMMKSKYIYNPQYMYMTFF